MSQALTQKRKDQISKEVLKLRREPENLKCADCSNRNCSYVCVNFNTFICSDCAGLYRKHCFRVKSCTVATFTEKEYENLKTSGGNEACNRKYMAKWKKKAEFPVPKQGDLKALDTFIHKKYVLKEWYKEVKDKKKKKKKKKKKVDDSETKDSESKTKSKPPSSTGSKQSQENQQLERDFLESEAALETKDEDWDPWGEKSIEIKNAEPPVQQAPPEDDFLSGFVFHAPTQTTNKSNDDWDPFGSSSQPTPQTGVTAPPKVVHEKKQSVDYIEELLSNINVNNTKNNTDFGMKSLETAKKKAMPAEEKPKSPYDDPFSTLIDTVPAPQPVASSTTSPQLQVRAAPPPTQQLAPVQYPMYMNNFGAQYGMTQPPHVAQMNPYAPQYNMAAQQAVNPFDTQVPTNVGPMMGQMPQMPYNNPPQAQMNAFNYQMAPFEIRPTTQVSQDNPFS